MQIDSNTQTHTHTSTHTHASATPLTHAHTIHKHIFLKASLMRVVMTDANAENREIMQLHTQAHTRTCLALVHQECEVFS